MTEIQQAINFAKRIPQHKSTPFFVIYLLGGATVSVLVKNLPYLPLGTVSEQRRPLFQDK